MNSILTWSLDKIIYLIVILPIFFAEDIDSFGKILLILMVLILASLNSIKETIKNSNKDGS